MHMPTGIVVGFMLLAFVPAEAQQRSVAETRLFIAPIADRNLNVGPPLYEYLDRLMDAPECSGIVPVGREAIADFSVWFEFKDTFRRGTHYYRERFLAEKYGPDVIDVSAATAGAEDFESTYPEAFEELPEEPRRKDDPDDGGSSG